MEVQDGLGRTSRKLPRKTCEGFVKHAAIHDRENHHDRVNATTGFPFMAETHRCDAVVPRDDEMEKDSNA